MEFAMIKPVLLAVLRRTEEGGRVQLCLSWQQTGDKKNQFMQSNWL